MYDPVHQNENNNYIVYGFIGFTGNNLLMYTFIFFFT